MNTFSVACLMAATSTAVPIATESIVLNNLSAKISDKVATGAITVIDGGDDIFVDHAADIAPAVHDAAEQIDSVVAQIEAGFEAIQELNVEIEAEQYADVFED